MRPLPGFRDFYPEDCARRGYVLDGWRAVARRYGFVEVDGPTLEPMELYAKKNESGAEILGQLYNFTDRGEREVALRPEMTPTLARMVIAKERAYRKPLKWFSASTYFRYERQQKGRLREFIQFNADLIGDGSTAADAELISLAIDLLREFGFTEKDFMVRLSSRELWWSFLQEKRTNTRRGASGSELNELLSIIDRLEKQPDEISNKLLEPLGTSAKEIREWSNEWSQKIFDPKSISGNTPLANIHCLLHQHLAPRGFLKYVEVDFSIVRGLAYYTGLVFEAFDRSKSMRALAGGGRYDELLGDLSDGAVKLPAIGFGMGDVVLGNLIEETPHAREKMERTLAASPAAEIYVVIAEEARRRESLGLVQSLRDAGWRTDFPLDAAKVGKQFQSAEALGARFAVVVGGEWPEVKVKTLATRAEETIDHAQLGTWLGKPIPSPSSSC